MLSLLALSLALSTPAAVAAQAQVTAANPLVAPPQSFVLVQPNGSMTIEEMEDAVRPFDNMEIHPDKDVCYKIRAYIFTKGQNPRFLRETTCGPLTPSAKRLDGTKPGFMPLGLKANPANMPQE